MKVNESWRVVWNKKGFIWQGHTEYSKNELFLKLKELNGFDVVDGGLSYESFMEQYLRTKSELMYDSESMTFKDIESIYEVGCGSGANLFMFAEDGIKVGGIDYSESLVQVAREVLKHSNAGSAYLDCGEAIDLPLGVTYDCVLSNSVFSYFPDFEYAKETLKKMLKICRRNIGILDIHYDKRKDDFIEYRRRIVPDYDERYKDLGKLFYSKEFFTNFAEKNNLDIKFTNSTMDGYWNNDFIFNCFLYQR